MRTILQPLALLACAQMWTAAAGCGHGCPDVDACLERGGLPWLGGSVDLPIDRPVEVMVTGCRNDVCSTGHVTSDPDGTARCTSADDPALSCELTRNEDGGQAWYLAAALGDYYRDSDRIHVEAWSEGVRILAADAIAVQHQEERGTDDCPQVCGWTTLEEP